MAHILLNANEMKKENYEKKIIAYNIIINDKREKISHKNCFNLTSLN